MRGLEWIAVDWGTSNMRLWALDKTGAVLDSRSSDLGMAKLARDEFETALLDLIEPWIRDVRAATPVIACGMVGARQGWQEVPYEAVPCRPSIQLSRVETQSPGVDVRICWGLKQLNPADVMRGEETQIAGLLGSLPGFEGVVCLPGTHSKWARLAKGEVTEFQSYMTGEIYELLSKSSVLRFSIDSQDWSDEQFDAAVQEALAEPEKITGRLFGLRAEALVSENPRKGGAARLSGYLIGLELASTRAYWEAGELAIIGASTLAKHYQRALSLVGRDSALLDTQDMTLAGLTAAYLAYKEQTDV